jgi:hypothetical protein
VPNNRDLASVKAAGQERRLDLNGIKLVQNQSHVLGARLWLQRTTWSCGIEAGNF